MLHIVEARHPGPRCLPSDRLAIECVNVGGLALAIVEHRLIPARARFITNGLQVKSGYASVWPPACQDFILGGHAGVGVVSLQVAPVSLPSFCTAEFDESCRFVCGLWKSRF